MSTSFDTIVVGLGAMGASTVYQLAKRGVRTLGIEQFDIPTAKSSSHGFSRMIRLAYFEHPDYIPLLRQSYTMWHTLEAEIERKIIHITGGLYMGTPDSSLIDGGRKSVAAYRLPHENLSHAELRRRFPQFTLPEDYVGLLDLNAGAVLPEAAISAFAELAMRMGAELHGHEALQSWQPDGTGVALTTTRGTYRAAHLIFCGGPWTGKIVGDLGVSLTVTRQMLGWFWPKRPAAFALGTFPVWILAHRDGTNHYGFPMMRDNPGFKFAFHGSNVPVDPDTLDRQPNADDEATLRWLLEKHIPEANGPLLSLRACMYTNSPDRKFILDRHPQYPQVAIACGFSGHGFKFAPVVGRATADLSADGMSPLPIDFLSLKRFNL